MEKCIKYIYNNKKQSLVIEGYWLKYRKTQIPIKYL